MAFIPIDENPVLNLDMEQLLTSTPAYAPIFNRESKQLLENDKSIYLQLLDALNRIRLLELMFSADVTGNPFIINFDTLDDVIVEGSWNQNLNRIEF